MWRIRIQNSKLKVQFENFRQTVVDKDQVHLKQMSENLLLKEKINQIEDNCSYFKQLAEDKQEQVTEVSEKSELSGYFQ